MGEHMAEPDQATPAAKPAPSRRRTIALIAVILVVATVVGVATVQSNRARVPILNAVGDPRASGPDAGISFVLQEISGRPGGSTVVDKLQTALAGGTDIQTVLDGEPLINTEFTGFAWSPDGTRVAFVRATFDFAPPIPDGVYVMKPDGTGATRIKGCQGQSCPTRLSWSPDGRQIAYVGARTLGVMDGDGSHDHPIYSCPKLPCLQPVDGPSWSPDSSRLVFAAADRDNATGLFIVGAQGGALRTVMRCYASSCEGGASVAPAWSPDGGEIAFHQEQNVFLIRPDGTGLLQLTSCRTEVASTCKAAEPAWSSDGARIAYAARDGIHIVGRDGSADRLVIASPPSEIDPGNIGHVFSFCCLSWKPVPGVRMVNTEPAGQSAPALAIGPVVTPPPGVGQVIAPGDWPQFRGSNELTGLNPSESAIGTSTVSKLSQRWVASVGNEEVLMQSPVVVGGQLFVGARDGNLYAFNAEGCGAATCPPEWAGSTSAAINDTPNVANGDVYVGSARGLYVFDASGCGRTTCQPLWVGRTSGPIVYSSPIVTGGMVYVGTEQDTRLYAFPASGCGAPTCAPAWIGTGFVTNTGVDGTPAIADGVVYIHANDPYLYVFQASGCGAPTCPPLWKGDTHTDGEDESSAAISGGYVYVAGGECDQGDCGLFVFRASGCGQEICQPAWVDLPTLGFLTSPAVANGVVYFVAGTGQLYAFDARGCNGDVCTEPLWSGGSLGDGGGFGSSPAVAGGLVFFRSDASGQSTGTIVAYRATGCGASSCDPIWTAAAGGDAGSSPAVSNGMVFVGGTDSIVHAYALS
jgi:outer membrane protein assembly factor BamB/Tol biopolymer transport system component